MEVGYYNDVIWYDIIFRSQAPYRWANRTIRHRILPGIRTRNLLITTIPIYPIPSMLLHIHTTWILQMGLEPTTFCSEDRCSAIEPLKLMIFEIIY